MLIHHSRRTVPKQLTHRRNRHPAFQAVRAVRVPNRVRDDTLEVELAKQVSEPDTNRVSTPGASSAVAEHRAGRILRDQPPTQLYHQRSQINHQRSSGPLGLV